MAEAPLTPRRRPPRLLAAVAAAVVALGALAFLLLDGFATRMAREQADAWSVKLGRKIEVGRVSTTFFTGLGAKVGPLSVGPAQGEVEPLLGIGQVEVRVAALKAIASLGKTLEIRSVELSRPELNVVRFADGTTNVERLQARLAQVQGEEGAAAGKPAQKPGAGAPAAQPRDLSAVRVDHAALHEGRITFVDRSGKKPEALAVRQIELTVDDLRQGQPLRVLFKAAVLGAQQNFELELAAAPLPPTLVPTPTRLRLRVQPAIDLSPLAPFLPPGVGLQAGKLDADFDAALGAAVAGGSGPTTVKGTLRALALQFEGAQAGKPLDIVLDADVKADAVKGDVALDKLRFDVGPAGISGKGSAHGLMTGQPRIEGLEIASHDLDPEKLAAWYPPLRKSLGARIGGPIALSVRAAGGADAQQLEARLDFTQARLSLPQSLSKAAGAPMSLIAHVQGSGEREQRFDVKADLAGVDLRPGQSLDKRPGDRMELSLVGVRKVSGVRQRIDLSQVVLRVKEDELSGKGSAELDAAKKTTRFDLDLRGPHLDLDKLLLSSSAETPKSPPPDPRSFQGLSGRAAVRVDSLLYKKQAMRAATVVARLEGDRLTLEEAGAEAFSGKVSAAGTTLQLAHPDQPFHLKAQMSGVDLSQATSLVAAKKVLGGKLEASIDLDGAGQKAAAIVKSLAGNLNGHVLDGAFFGKDLIAAVAGPLAKALPFGSGVKPTAGGQTTLGKDLPVSITFANGQARLGKPISVKLPEGDISMSGAIGLDGKLDMPGTVTLQPSTIARLTGGKATVTEAIPIRLRLIGLASAPQVADLDLKDAAAAIVKGAASSALGRVLGTSGQGDAQQQAREAAQKQEQAVQQQAAQKAQEQERAARQKAQDEAKKAADQASSQLKGIFGH